MVAVFQGGDGADARSPEFQASIADSLDRLLADERVDGDRRLGRDPATTGSSARTGPRRTSSSAWPSPTRRRSTRWPELRALIDQPTDLTLLLTGVAPATQDQAEQSEKELVQAETVSFPFAALILILVFASLVAAGMPLVVAALAIPTTLAGVYLAAQVTELSIYVQNVATMLGLALAIDYSLFMVSRFREELRRGRDVGTAVDDHRRDERQGGHVLRGWRSPSGCRACSCSSRPRSARSASAGR